LIDHRQSWGEDRVFFLDERDNLRSLPASWTSLLAKDPFVDRSGGKSCFHIKDLIELSQLVRGLKEANKDRRKKGAAGESVT